MNEEINKRIIHNRLMIEMIELTMILLTYKIYGFEATMIVFMVVIVIILTNINISLIIK